MKHCDYYATLGVARSASQEEIRKAYRNRARRCHPDVSTESDAEEQFKCLAEAYAVLGDVESRAKYDRYGVHWKSIEEADAPRDGSPARGGFAASDFARNDLGDFFQQFFQADGQPPWSRARRRWAQPGVNAGAATAAGSGANIEVRVQLGLRAAYRGGQRDVRLRDTGRGKTRTLRVKIPPGTVTGQRIRLKGQGAPGLAGNAAGHLDLIVDVQPEDGFRLDGRDVYTEIPVAVWTAALGGSAVLQTLDDKVRVKIPTGSSSGQRIRLRQRGFGAPDKRGDLIAEIRLVVPAKLSAEQRALFEKLADASEDLTDA